MARQAAEGVEQGNLALVDAVRSSAAASEETLGRLEDGFRPPSREPIPVELIALRVIAERLQLPDPTDPALAESHLAVTARVSLGGSVIAAEVIDEIDVRSFQPQGAFIDLNRVLYEGVVQSGESLVIEILTGVAARERVASERLRFNDTLTGTPSTWIGSHISSRSQEWRLWYRIEKTDKPHETPSS
jgi:hypothetical protein